MRKIARRLISIAWPLLLASPLVSAADAALASDAAPTEAEAARAGTAEATEVPDAEATEATEAEAESADVGPFTDPKDGAFDVSSWLLERKGFLPVPLIISEPAIGYGGGLTALFFRGTLANGMASRRLSPPDIYGVMLAATDNGTRFGGAFGMKTFGQENWRWKGAVGRPDINIDFYGAGGDLGTGDTSIAYNLEGWATTQQLMRRIGEGGNFIGGRWVWLDLASRFNGAALPPPIAERSRDATNSGLGLFFEHDSRDNIFTASRGWKGYLESMFYSPDFGGDNRFEMYRAYAIGYLPVREAFVLGGRVDFRAARGDVPFYQLPYIEMRGIPAARYQDENIALVEAEVRWNATPRWAFVGFAGTARSWGTNSDFGDADSASAYGLGVRRLIARRLGMYVGLDVARGPEETAFYIQAGSAWR